MDRFVNRLLILVAAVLVPGAAPPQHSYAAGQIWEYKTRPGDEGSLLKIQQVEDNPAFQGKGQIYHISVIGFHLANPQVTPVLPHAPVSRQTLDASVTRLTTSSASFPDAAPGIAQWREAKGGVFTISVAQIVEILDQQTRAVGQ